MIAELCNIYSQILFRTVLSLDDSRGFFLTFRQKYNVVESGHWAKLFHDIPSTISPVIGVKSMLIARPERGWLPTVGGQEAAEGVRRGE